jgi:hypothetical protein
MGHHKQKGLLNQLDLLSLYNDNWGSTACTSMSTRRGKTIVPTMEKAVVVMEVNKKKKEEAGLAKVLDPKKGIWIGQNSRIGLLACNITI